MSIHTLKKKVKSITASVDNFAHKKIEQACLAFQIAKSMNVRSNHSDENYTMMSCKAGIGKFNMNIVDNAIEFFVGITILFLLVANLLPEAQHGGNNIAATGAPLATLFNSQGVLFLIIMAGLLILVARSSRGGKR